MSPSIRSLTVLALFAGLLTYLSEPIRKRFSLLGLFRTVSPGRYEEVVFIDDTVHCEDLHYLSLTNEIFTACEDNDQTRLNWLPQLARFDNPTGPFAGSLHVVDAVTLKSKRLAFKNFNSSFVTHGIDVIPDRDQPNAYFIFAVNHLPNPDFLIDPKNALHGRSQIEVFHHQSGSDFVEHVRSVRHPLIKTPNDIYAIDPHSFYVTNDHYYQEGLLRHVEDVFTSATWSNTIYVTFSAAEVSDDASKGVTASIALQGLHNNNGMGHVRNALGEDQGEILLGSTSTGTLYRAVPLSSQTDDKNNNDKESNNHNLTIIDSIELETFIDNPSYFSDPYATTTTTAITDSNIHNASGYILASVPNPLTLISQSRQRTAKDAALVWHVVPRQQLQSSNITSSSSSAEKWFKRIIFQDDGTLVRGASTAVLVPIVPPLVSSPDGCKEKKAWLFVTGVFASSVIAVKIDLLK